MPIIATVSKPEQWIIQVNGGYDIMFESLLLLATAVDGQVLPVTAEYSGIVSGGGVVGDIVRVCVRGNPSLIDASKLTGTTTLLDKSLILV